MRYHEPVSIAGLCLLLASSAALARDLPRVEAPLHCYAEADAEVLARRERACRADLADYLRQPSPDFLDRLVKCMDHPDADLRAQVLDSIPDRRLWDSGDYDARVNPVMEGLYERFRKDPDARVRLHASQLRQWLTNARSWRDWESPAAQARRRAERQQHPGRSRVDGASERLGDYALAVTAIAVVLTGLIGRRFLR